MLKKTIFLNIIAFLLIAGNINIANAATVSLDELNEQIWSTPIGQREMRKYNNIYKDPTPTHQDGPTVNNPWKPCFKTNRYCAHHVWFESCTCWLNIAVARAKELVGRDIKIYYDADSVFVVHFRNPREATAALNILLQGENVELPPYWVEKEV